MYVQIILFVSIFGLVEKCIGDYYNQPDQKY